MKDNVFPNALTKRGRFLSNPGSAEKILYHAEYDKDGKMVIVAHGKENLADFIDSFRESCDINNILKRFANGDTSALQAKQGIFGDFGSMPRTYAEMLNTVILGEQAFDKLPIEIKQKFNNSFAQWLASYGSSEFVEKMGLASPSPLDKVDKMNDSGGEGDSHKE